MDKPDKSASSDNYADRNDSDDSDDLKAPVGNGNSGGHNNSGSSNNRVGSGDTDGRDTTNNARRLAKNENTNASDDVQHSKGLVNEQNASEVNKSTSRLEKSESAGGAVNTIVSPGANVSSGTSTSAWKLGVGLMELVVLSVISLLVISDVKVIRWFEQKKKKRL